MEFLKKILPLGVGVTVLFGLTFVIPELLPSVQDISWQAWLQHMLFVAVLTAFVFSLLKYADIKYTGALTKKLDEIDKTIDSIKTELLTLKGGNTEPGKEETEVTGLVSRIEKASNELESKIIPQFIGNSSDEQTSLGIVKSLANTIENLDLINSQIVYYENNPTDTLAKVICSERMIGSDTKTVRLNGTMMGVAGPGSYSISKHIIELTKKRIEANFPAQPFKDCRVVSPNIYHGSGKDYISCSRFFALDVLLEIKPILDNAEKIQYENTSINIRYKGHDCFPAWHVWGNEKFVMLCSVGHRDNRTYTLADAVPIVIGAWKNFEKTDPFGNRKSFDLSASITRISDHFDKDLFQYKKEEIECWRLDQAGNIIVMNFQSNVGGTKDKAESIMSDLEVAWPFKGEGERSIDEICKASKEPGGTQLSDKEAGTMRDIFKIFSGFNQ